MDPFSIVAFAATILELGLRVSGQMNGVISTWKTADPVILALANEISDLNLVLHHMSHTWHTVRNNAGGGAKGGTEYNESFLAALNDLLSHAERLLQQLEVVVLEVASLSKTRRKFVWLKRHGIAKDLQVRLRGVRTRATELLLAYNV
jgi:hypothetical protein